MSNNQSRNMEENPLRGFTFVQFSNSFNNMLYHFRDDVEIVCMSVRFPALRQKKAKAILRRSLRACREIVNYGIDLKFHVFQLFDYEGKRPSGTFRIIFFVPGGTVCTGVRLRNNLKGKLKRYAQGAPFRVWLNRPKQSEYEGALVFSHDNLQSVHSWLADCLWDTQACSCGLTRNSYLHRPQKYSRLLVG